MGFLSGTRFIKSFLRGSLKFPFIIVSTIIIGIYCNYLSFTFNCKGMFYVYSYGMPIPRPTEFRHLQLINAGTVLCDMFFA